MFLFGGKSLIQALWIITDTGQCIFSHKYIEQNIDDQLISGLLTAFDAFSKESGIGGIQQIAGVDSQFIYGSTGKLLVAALADKRDNGALVEKLMKKISTMFQEKFSQHLLEMSYIDLNIFNGFEKEINQILKPKIYKRGVGSTIFAILVTIALTAGILFFLLDFIQGTQATFLIFLAFIPGLFIGAIIAGKSTFGLISSIIGVLPIITISSYYIVENALSQGQSVDSIVFTIVLMAEQFLTIAILCGILGGGFIDRRRLFPLRKNGKRIDVFPANAVVASPNLGEQSQPEIPQTDYYAQSSSLVKEKTEGH